MMNRTVNVCAYVSVDSFFGFIKVRFAGRLRRTQTPDKA